MEVSGENRGGAEWDLLRGKMRRVTDVGRGRGRKRD